MRAIRVHRTGGPEVMQVDDVPTPRPGPGEAVVRVEAAGVNFIDVYYRTGQYAREPPFGLGEEGAGVVDAVGEGVSGLRAGERVAWSGAPGSYATHVVARAGALVPVPEGVSTRDAAAVMLQGMTAHYLACSTFPLKKGDSCLIHAAAGGVGLLLVQTAKRIGARVLGTRSSSTRASGSRRPCAPIPADGASTSCTTPSAPPRSTGACCACGHAGCSCSSASRADASRRSICRC
jgi:NADPH2:quinone reductase